MAMWAGNIEQAVFQTYFRLLSDKKGEITTLTDKKGKGETPMHLGSNLGLQTEPIRDTDHSDHAI